MSDADEDDLAAWGRWNVNRVSELEAEMAELRAQVAALTAERDRLVKDLAAATVEYADKVQTAQATTRAERLIRQQAEAERDRLVAGIDKLVEQWGADDGAHGSELAALLRRTPE